ncbi:MAG TPA: 2-C-methyl-D-erythritol 4-phosphate cytidylyltransferase [Thermotogota bacterium]|nr:2-C-methyl-D-erythritol 4-phosphate cytidylyltransferase [Thermotogota bacterium]HRW34302.1 2-C-methyl-D-erythritol 4-phosphate cytidylyltransferase [Thermotogota bacterium]
MNIALILAAGKGQRFDRNIPKQFASLNGKPVLEYSLDIVAEMEQIDRIVIVTHPDYEQTIREIGRKYSKTIAICEGGSTRQESVYKGLKRIKEMRSFSDASNVLIHDSARPFAKFVFHRVMEKLKTEKAVVPVINTKDTIYVIQKNKIVDIPCRDYLFNVQTPQGFSFPLILESHVKAAQQKLLTFTDDGSLYTAIQKCQPSIVEGDQMNFKITDQKDRIIAEYFLSHEKEQLR